MAEMGGKAWSTATALAPLCLVSTLVRRGCAWPPLSPQGGHRCARGRPASSRACFQKPCCSVPSSFVSTGEWIQLQCSSVLWLRKCLTLRSLHRYRLLRWRGWQQEIKCNVSVVVTTHRCGERWGLL